jgi:hypothetical protein
MSENGAKPSTTALDAFAELMRRGDLRLGDVEINEKRITAVRNQLERRIEALEALHRDADKQPPQEAPLTPVGELLKVARKAWDALCADERFNLARELEGAIKRCGGDVE